MLDPPICLLLLLCFPIVVIGSFEWPPRPNIPNQPVPTTTKSATTPGAPVPGTDPTLSHTETTVINNRTNTTVNPTVIYNSTVAPDPTTKLTEDESSTELTLTTSVNNTTVNGTASTEPSISSDASDESTEPTVSIPSTTVTTRSDECAEDRYTVIITSRPVRQSGEKSENEPGDPKIPDVTTRTATGSTQSVTSFGPSKSITQTSTREPGSSTTSPAPQTTVSDFLTTVYGSQTTTSDTETTVNEFLSETSDFQTTNSRPHTTNSGSTSTVSGSLTAFSGSATISSEATPSGENVVCPTINFVCLDCTEAPGETGTTIGEGGTEKTTMTSRDIDPTLVTSSILLVTVPIPDSPSTVPSSDSPDTVPSSTISTTVVMPTSSSTESQSTDEPTELVKMTSTLNPESTSPKLENETIYDSSTPDSTTSVTDSPITQSESTKMTSAPELTVITASITVVYSTSTDSNPNTTVTDMSTVAYNTSTSPRMATTVVGTSTVVNSTSTDPEMSSTAVGISTTSIVPYEDTVISTVGGKTTENTVGSTVSNASTTEGTTTTTVEGTTTTTTGIRATTSTEPDCSIACPADYYEGETFCIQTSPVQYSRTYADALTYCQREDNIDLMDEHEIQDNLKSIREMQKHGLLGTSNSSLIYINEHGTADIRRNKMARVVSLNNITRFTLRTAKNVSISIKNDDLIGLCRIQKACHVATCDLSVFSEPGVPPLSLPSFSTPLKESTSFTASCPSGGHNQTVSFQFDCSTRGHVEPHPSVVSCEHESDLPPHWEEESEINPRYQKSCKECHPRGTDNCTEVEGKGVECHCNPGWRMFSCWLSPDFCEDRNCSGNGKCVNKIDHGFCDCFLGFSGEECQVNRSAYDWNDPNKTSLLEATTIATVTLAGTSLGLFIMKLIVKIVILTESQDPQESYQESRSLMVSFGSIGILLFKHPELFNVDPVGCRFYFWAVAACYMIAQLFWLQEGVNARSVCLARNRNEWDLDFDGNKRSKYDYMYRVVPTYIFGELFVLVICMAGWDSVPSEWTCFAIFSDMNSSVWMPIFFLNGFLAVLSFTLSEHATLVYWRRPHYMVKMHHYLEVNDPFTRERVDKVYRNLFFVMAGPILHMLVWQFLALSVDQSSPRIDFWATVLSYIYTAHNIVQTIFTTPEIYYLATCAMMKYGPISLRPTHEKLYLRTYQEVIHKDDPNWIEKLSQESERKIKDQDEKETKEWNERVKREFPQAPAWMMREAKIEGPSPIIPPMPAIAPSHDEYVSIKAQERIMRKWNRQYLDERLDTRMNPEICAYEILKREMDAGMLDGTEEENSQMCRLWSRFYLYIPSTDHLNMSRRTHRNKIREALITFEFDSESCDEILSLEQISKDEYDLLVVKPFMKKPHPKMDYQIAGYDVTFSKQLADRNEEFDMCYDDDNFVLFLLNGKSEEEKEEIRRMLNVQPSVVEKGARTRNPRKREMDEYWFKEDRVGFIGPLVARTAPLFPEHQIIVTKQREYKKMAEELWAVMQEAALRIVETRQLRSTYWGML